MTSYADFICYDYIQIIADWLCSYYSIFLIVLGCICNVLSFLVFSRKAFRGTTMSVYLRLLAISDLGVIMNGFVPYVTQRSFNIQLRTNDISCKISMFVHFLLLYTSSWILVIVAVERAVSIFWPHRVKIFCSNSKEKVLPVLAIFLFVFGSLSVICAFQYSDFVVPDTSTNYTDVLDCISFNTQEWSLWIFITDSTMFAFIPSVVLIVCNFIIVNGVIESRKRILNTKMAESGSQFGNSSADRVKISVKRKWGENTVLREEEISISQLAQPKRGIAWPFQRTEQNNLQDCAVQNKNVKSNIAVLKRRTANETSLTIMLVTVSTTFIFCNFPICAYGFWVTFMTVPGPLEFAVNDILLILMYTNNSLNFLLYCVYGIKFRREVTAIFTEFAFSLRRVLEKIVK